MLAIDAENDVTHALFMDLTLGNVTYYLSNAYKPVTIDGNSYTALGAFIGIGSITEDLRTTNGDVQITLTGIPTDDNYLATVLTTPIKGGQVKVRRAFFDKNTLAIRYDGPDPQVYLRYQGIITNFAIDEEQNILTGDLNNSVSIICASLNSLLENKVAGQRTNGSDRRKYYPGDISFDRVKDLAFTQFDFGRKSNATASEIFFGNYLTRQPVQK
jgi:hypothetical protein